MELERWLGSQAHNLSPPHLGSVKPGKSWVLTDQNVAETESSRLSGSHLKTGKVGSGGDDVFISVLYTRMLGDTYLYTCIAETGNFWGFFSVFVYHNLKVCDRNTMLRGLLRNRCLVLKRSRDEAGS